MKINTEWETFRALYNKLIRVSHGKVRAKLGAEAERKKPKPKRA
jgi:hypothetical protein